jgi:hypothetical protein
VIDHEIRKPVLFISHATFDAEFANAVRREIEKVFAGGVDVFCTSSPGAISVGEDWLADIEKRLESAQAVVAIVTPVSIKRPWLWFEIGATWSKGRRGECKIYPLCAPQMDERDIPSPLDRLQMLSLSRTGDLKRFFIALITQFGFGNPSSFRSANILECIPKYGDIQAANADLDSDDVALSYAWKCITNYRSLRLTGESERQNLRFDILAHFVLAILNEDRPDEGFTHEYVYMRAYKALQHISEKSITYHARDFLNEMEVLKVVELVGYDLGFWNLAPLGYELIEKWPASWVYYSANEVAEILRISEALEFPTLEEADEIISEPFE